MHPIHPVCILCCAFLATSFVLFGSLLVVLGTFRDWDLVLHHSALENPADDSYLIVVVLLAELASCSIEVSQDFVA